MKSHELILLSPYRYPGHNADTPAEEEMAAWLSGWSVLWHPALLAHAQAPPRVASLYEFDQPKPNTIYVVTDAGATHDEAWFARVRGAGSIAFRAVPDRVATLANARVALAEATAADAAQPGLGELGEERGFFALGLGYLLVTTLSEAMEQASPVPVADFWARVQEAATRRLGEGGERASLVEAAQILLAARQVRYPVNIHLIDIGVLGEANLADPWPASLERGLPCAILASGRIFEDLASRQPDKLAGLRDAVAKGTADICGGCYLEREDPFLPLDSQFWSLRKGLEVTKRLVGEVGVFGRRRFGFHPQLPLLITSNGLTRALMVAFDEVSGLPHYSSCRSAWPSPDGKQVEAFTRAPLAADKAETFFNLGHHWYRTTRDDHVATLAFSHMNGPDHPWYGDLIELSLLAPVAGQWTTLTKYLNETQPGEHPWTPLADEFHSDYLTERVRGNQTRSVSGFARHVRWRRQLDGCATLAGLHHSLGGKPDTEGQRARLRDIEDALESLSPDTEAPELDGMAQSLQTLETEVARGLAERLQIRAAASEPGYMVLNPCAFVRRVALELEPAAKPIPIGGAVKACQSDKDRLRVVLELPPLGFVWLPRGGPPSAAQMPSRLRLADAASHSLRNEFFEADVDPESGGLKAIRDHRSKVNRLSQRLVFNPGSHMKAREVRVTSAGPALGEIVAAGDLLGDQGQILASFQQRYRAWLGRPLLEMRLEIQPKQAPAGYPWHAYFGARFAWRAEQIMLLRGVHGNSYTTTHTRPQADEFLEFRQSRHSTVLLTGGLPFHQRHENRMLDVILVPAGERETSFDLGIALDRDHPLLTSQGFVSPPIVVPTAKGPPHIGASGWLFQLDMPNLLLSRLEPGPMAPGNADAVTARFVECGGLSGRAELRCVRDPKKATLLDARGTPFGAAATSGDAVQLEVAPNDFFQLQVEFT